jgi:hypothetical protein
MGFVEDMKWWHWLAISILVGLVLGYSNASNTDLPAVHSSMGNTDFERYLIRDPAGPNHIPWVSDVTVYPPQPFRTGEGMTMKQIVTLKCLVVPENHQQDASIQWFTMVAQIPYEASPRWAPGYYGNRSYPGTTIYLAKRGDTLGSITAAEYGKDTRDGEDAIINANESLRTAESRALIHVRPFRMYFIPWNPDSNHTVVDLLKDAVAKGYHVDYRIGWWEASQYVYQIWIGGSVLVIGIIWPAILRLMKQGGLGRVATAQYDLSQFKTGKEKAPEKEAVGVTAADMERLGELADNMEASLRASGAFEGKAVGGLAPEAAAIKKLTGTAGDVAEPVTPESQSKEFSGEFYPVEKPKGKPEDQKENDG